MNEAAKRLDVLQCSIATAPCVRPLINLTFASSSPPCLAGVPFDQKALQRPIEQRSRARHIRMDGSDSFGGVDVTIVIDPNSGTVLMSLLFRHPYLIAEHVHAVDAVIDWEHDLGNMPSRPCQFAQECIDADATIFLVHGTTRLQGIERYREGLILHCLGSFIFQTRKPDGFYPAETWDSVIVELSCRHRTVMEGRVIPIVLDGARTSAEDEHISGLPRFADAMERRRIIQSLRTRNTTLGTALREREGTFIV